MRILVLSFYFQPDLSACAFRTTAFVESLQSEVPIGTVIDVITTLPNRYHSFSPDAPASEVRPGLSVTRIPLPKHKSGVIDQSRAFLAFAKAAMRHTEGRSYDIVFATSSRLMTASLGALLSRRTKGQLYLDIRDIFVDTITQVAARPIALSVGPLFSMLERWTIGQAARVNLVSPGFAGYFAERYPNQSFSFITNGIDTEFIAAAPDHQVVPSGPQRLPLTVLYAGNVGEGQGLETIVPSLAALAGSHLRFRIIGDGSTKSALEEALQRAGVSNVELLSPVGRGELIEAYREADILFLHLNAYEAFEKVLPSKFFEYAAMGKPIWAGVSGYAAEFVRAEIENSAVFTPGDAEGAMRALEELDYREAPRTEFVRRYARSHLSRALAQDVLSIYER
jgi:glycosyltransferase involved in cell wall biosynthesis